MAFLTNEKLTIVGAAGMIGSNMAQSALMMGLTTPQPLGNRWRPLNLQFHQLILGSLQLFLSSEEIARVRPEGSRRQRHHRRTRRTVETADPLPTLPMVGHIFTLMRIRTGEDAGRKMLPPHHFPKTCQTLINIHFLFVFVISTLQRYK